MRSALSARHSVYKSKIFLFFVIYGLGTGIFSYLMGYGNDFALLLNFPGKEASRVIYNDILAPYWKGTMEPSGYEEIPTRELETGRLVGTEKVPVYDFPMLVEDLYIPISVLTWGLIGLGLALLYRTSRQREKR